MIPLRAAYIGLRFATALISTFLLLNLSVLLSRSLLASDLLVAAAADLTPVEAPLAAAFAKNSGAKVVFATASSGSLARQIQNGAPYDVFLSANDSLIKELVASGHLAADSVEVYAYGRVALWSRNPAIRSLQDLLAPGVLHLAIANPLHAPYGVAAQQVLKNRGLWDKLAGKIVYGENVQQAFQFAQSGNAEAAITAWSLVFDRGGILLPAEWHAPVRQAGGVVSSSKQFGVARRFLLFLTGREGKELLRRYGLN